MRNGRPGGMNGVASRAARARAERLWSETVAVPSAPSDDSGESKDPRRPLNGAPTESSLPAGPATRKLRALWISAFHLGLIRDSSDAALGAWIHRQRGLGAEAYLSADGLARAIPALEAWLARGAGVDWRPHFSLGRSGHVREIRRPRARVLEAQWRILYRQGRVRIASLAALGAYAARHAGLGRADSHIALSDA